MKLSSNKEAVEMIELYGGKIADVMINGAMNDVPKDQISEQINNVVEEFRTDALNKFGEADGEEVSQAFNFSVDKLLGETVNAAE